MGRRRFPASEDVQFARFRTTGDPDAFATVYDLTSVTLLRSATALLGDLAQAEDALQQTFLRAIECADRYDDRRPLMPWLFAILVNESRVIRRRRRRECAALEGECQSRLPDPHDSAVQAEFSVGVDVAISQLPHHYQSVLRLRLKHGLSNPAIAQQLGLKVATVRIQLMRGLGLLRRALPAGFAGALLAPSLAAAPGLSSSSGLAEIRRNILERAVQTGFPAAVGTRSVIAKAVMIAATVLLCAGLISLGWPVDLDASNPGGASVAQVSPPTAHVTAMDGVRRQWTLPIEATAIASAGTRLQISIRHADGLAAGRQWVRVRPLGVVNPYLHDRWLQVDAAGGVTVGDLPVGPVEVIGGQGGFAKAVLQAGRLTMMAVTLKAGYSIVGTVVDDRGEPVPRARVWLSIASDPRFGHEVAAADEHGRFSIDAVEGERHVGCRANGHAATALVRTSAGPGGRVSVRLLMSRGSGEVRGRVVDPDGRPVARARVIVGRLGDLRLRPDAAGRRGYGWPPFRVTADDSGRFEVVGLPLGRTFLAARAPGYVGCVHRVEIDTEPAAERILTLRRGAIVGRVTDREGRPVAGARIGCDAVTDGWNGMGVITDANGHYRLEGVHSPTVTLWVNGGSHGVDSRRVKLGANEVEVRWDPVLTESRAPIRGVLLGPDDRPLAGWTIDVRSISRRRWHEPWKHFVITDQRGRFETPFAAVEEHALFALPPGIMCPCGPRVMVRPRERDWVVRLPPKWMPTAAIQGRVVDEEGRVIPGVKLAVTRAYWVVRRTHYRDHVWFAPAADGSFRLDRIPPGTYELAAYAPGYAPRSISAFELAAMQVEDLGVIRLKAKGTAHKMNRYPLPRTVRK